MKPFHSAEYLTRAVRAFRRWDIEAQSSYVIESMTARKRMVMVPSSKFEAKDVPPDDTDNTKHGHTFNNH